MNSNFTIDGRTIGAGHPCYIIAELSANHHGDYDQTVELIRAAKEAGADAIKVQTYTADTLTIACDREQFRIGPGTIWEGRTLHDLYQEASMPWEWQPRLQEVAHSLDLHFFSTPFDSTALRFLEEMKVPAYKIASFELVDLPLIRAVARTGKPLIMSTGMASFEEIDEAVRVARENSAGGLALLKCTSAYPSPPAEMNLRGIAHLAESFSVPAGLSDHTLGTAVPVAAVALGAKIIEKHLTLSRAIPGPDSTFSLEPREFREMVEAVRVAEQSIGEVSYTPTPREEASRVFRRSLFVVEDVRAGEIFTERNVRSIRPGHGLPPKLQDQILGQTARCDIARGTPLSWDLIATTP